jgi:hypothetical protein
LSAPSLPYQSKFEMLKKSLNHLVIIQNEEIKMKGLSEKKSRADISRLGVTIDVMSAIVKF